MPGIENATWIPRDAEPTSDPTRLVVDEQQGQADHDRRDRDRQVDCRVEQARAREAMTRQQDRSPDPEDRVEGHRDRGHHEGQYQSVDEVVGADSTRVGEVLPGLPRTPVRTPGTRSSRPGPRPASQGNRRRRSAVPIAQGTCAAPCGAFDAWACGRPAPSPREQNLRARRPSSSSAHLVTGQVTA